MQVLQPSSMLSVVVGQASFFSNRLGRFRTPVNSSTKPVQSVLKTTRQDYKKIMSPTDKKLEKDHVDSPPTPTTNSSSNNGDKGGVVVNARAACSVCRR
jgi:hypothetical protein